MDASFCPSCGQALEILSPPVLVGTNSGSLALGIGNPGLRKRIVWGVVVAVALLWLLANNLSNSVPTAIPTVSGSSDSEPSATPTETAPWYPSGYKELTYNVAYKAFASGTMDCGYSSAHSCFQAYFVTNTTCNLFVDVNFLKDGVVVDNGIDSANIAAGEKAIMSFASMKAARYEGKGTVKITDVTCY